jgi:hypothetical protein
VFFERTSGGVCAIHSERSIVASFGEGPLIENQEKLGPIGAKALDRVGESGWEDPEVALLDVANKHRSIGIHDGDARFAVKHVCPFIRCMPVQLSIATGSKTHIHTGNILRRGKRTLCHFVRPSTVFDAFLHKIEGIPQRHYIAMICWWWVIGVRILG